VRSNSKDGAAKRKLDLMRSSNSEFKDLAEQRGWKFITVHEKMNP
jgi:hypothetical protein